MNLSFIFSNLPYDFSFLLIFYVPNRSSDLISALSNNSRNCADFEIEIFLWLLLKEIC